MLPEVILEHLILKKIFGGGGRGTNQQIFFSKSYEVSKTCKLSINMCITYLTLTVVLFYVMFHMQAEEGT